MKRIIQIISLLMAICACLAFAGCKNNLNVDGEDKNWAFVMVSSAKNGDVIYTSYEFSNIYPDAMRADLSIRFKNGVFILTDREMQMPYSGKYELIDQGLKSAAYSISIQVEEEVYAGEISVTEAKMYDGSREYTLIITVADRNIYFKSIK